LAKRKRVEDRMLLAIGVKLAGKRGVYTIEKLVGSGAFACVYSAKDNGVVPRRVAVKEYFQGRPSEQEHLVALYRREAMVAAEASKHPLVPEFIEALSLDGYNYIITEFIEGTQLDDLIFKHYPLPREWILRWAVSICDVLTFLHSREIIHFDLKPANIKIDPDGRVKLFDYGSSLFFGKRGKKEKEMQAHGTDGYLAPELTSEGISVADSRTDIFALGCILFEMLAGDSPDQEQLNRKSVYVTNALIHKPHADLGLIAFINKALSYNTEYRYVDTELLLIEMAEFAPPVLLVDVRTLRFGAVTAGQGVPPQRVIPYNVGGGTLNVTVRPLVPWLIVKSIVTQEQTPGFMVQVVLNKVREFNKLLTGFIEVSSSDVFDENGAVVFTGQHWKLPCTIKVMPKDGSIVIPGQISGQGQPIWITGRQGQSAVGTFELHNSGEAPVHVFVARNLASESPAGAERLKQLIIEPEAATLEPGKTVEVTVKTSKPDFVAADYRSGLEVRTSEGYKFPVPLSVRQLGKQTPEELSRSLYPGSGPIELQLHGPAVEAAIMVEREAKKSNRTITRAPTSNEGDIKPGGLKPLGSLFDKDK